MAKTTEIYVRPDSALGATLLAAFPSIADLSFSSLCSRIRTSVVSLFGPQLCARCRPRLEEAVHSGLTPLLVKKLCIDCRKAFVKSADEKERPEAVSPAAHRFAAEHRLSSAFKVADDRQKPLQKIILRVAPSAALSKPAKSWPPRLPLGALDRSRSIYESLTTAEIDWCRYCGTTNGVNWRPGPWGQKTLCNRHGCDYKGYGFSKGISRLDLTLFKNESAEERRRPVISDFCFVCWEPLAMTSQKLACFGCPRSYHQKCYESSCDAPPPSATTDGGWCCSQPCMENFAARSVSISLPSKACLPYVKSSAYFSREGQTPRRTPTDSSTRRSTPRPFRAHNPEYLASDHSSPLQPRKRRRDTEPSDFIVSDFHVSVPRLEHRNIPIPTWRAAAAAPEIASHLDKPERIGDSFYAKRHERYEYVEKHMRLLRPTVLERLRSNPPSAESAVVH